MPPDKPATIDFRIIKEHARFDQVVARYGMRLEGTGPQRFVLCPFHQEKHASMHINVERNLFYCFGCEAKGDIINFVSCIEKISLRDAATAIAHICGLAVNDLKLSGQSIVKTGRHQGMGAADGGNVPLRFRLQLDPRHPYLAKRSISPQDVEVFGLGYCGHGIMKNRICIPIHDETGKLVAYAGRFAADDVPPGQLRYKLPPGFKKSCALFNLHRVAGKTDHLVVVEGYWSVFRLHAMNVPAVALMGRTLSDRQEDLLRSTEARLVTLLLDGDTPGRESTTKLLPRLAKNFFVRSPALSDGEAPDTMPKGKLREAVQA